MRSLILAVPVVVVVIVACAPGSSRARGLEASQPLLLGTPSLVEPPPADERITSLRGKTLRWTFTDGPVAGTVYEHELHENGTISWSVLEGAAEGESATEREYAAVKVSDDVHAVSYRAESGYTLTVVLNLADGRAYGFASNVGSWYALTGAFEIVE